MSELDSAFSKIERMAKSDGAEVELLIERGEKLAISFQNREMHKFDSSETASGGFRVIKGGVAGYAFTENLSQDSLVDAYRMALENVAFASRGGEPGHPTALYDSDGEIAEIGELIGATTDSIDEKMQRARTLESASLEFDSRITNVPYSGYSESKGELLIFSSAGLRRRQRSTSVSGYSSGLAKQGEESCLYWDSWFSRGDSDFDAEEIARGAARGALSQLGAKPPETGRYPVVVERDSADGFLGCLIGYFSAKSVDEKASLFASDLGATIAGGNFNLTDDPFYRGGLATCGFDREGARAQATPIIQNGVLVNFLTNSHYARKMRLPHTANASRGSRSQLGIGPSNLVVKPGTKSTVELLKSAPRMIYLTQIHALHAGFNRGSGDFSLPARGELWESGVRVRPLSDFVVSGNVRELLSRIEDVANDAGRPRSTMVTPDWLVSEMSVAGK